jgi:hypothetical protein
VSHRARVSPICRSHYELGWVLAKQPRDALHGHVIDKWIELCAEPQGRCCSLRRAVSFHRYAASPMESPRQAAALPPMKNDFNEY